MGRSESSLAAVLLTQRLVDGAAQPLKASEYWAVMERVGHPKELFGLGADAIAADFGVDRHLAERVAARLEQATQVVFALDDAEQRGLRVVASVDDDYPPALAASLGTAAPPLLYVAGDPRLLHRGGLGIVGSRDVSPAGAEVATEAARRAAAGRVPVISGAAKGVDRLAMVAALEAGGQVAGVVAESLTRLVRDPDTRRAITDGALCLCTPYNPTAGFSVANAMGRNKLIYALSTATLVVAADHQRGGTWAGAAEALRHRYAPVLVWMGDGRGDGNMPLVDQGATAIADVDLVVPPDRFRAADAAPDPEEQLTLDV
jgi:predicted Rossmann fold nucleotide-binding protein DprA/Smf involved in DNA uptake